jgi:hypothetical protein
MSTGSPESATDWPKRSPAAASLAVSLLCPYNRAPPRDRDSTRQQQATRPPGTGRRRLLLRHPALQNTPNSTLFPNRAAVARLVLNAQNLSFVAVQRSENTSCHLLGRFRPATAVAPRSPVARPAIRSHPRCPVEIRPRRKSPPGTVETDRFLFSNFPFSHNSAVLP